MVTPREQLYTVEGRARYTVSKKKKSMNTAQNRARRRAQARGRPATANQVRNRAEQSMVDKAMGQANRARVRGRGGYWADFRGLANKGLNYARQRIPKGTAAAIGQELGGPLGALAGQAFSHITGMGDYAIKYNTLVKGAMPPNASFSDTPGCIRIQREECLGNVIVPTTEEGGSDAFSIQSYRIQPTNTRMFPWLSVMAGLFTEYRIIGMIVKYETTASNYAANLALGQLTIATQYNSNSLPYTDMMEMLNSAFCTKGNPAQNLGHGIECDPKVQASDALYVRGPGDDGAPNLYDHGVVYVATEGLPTDAAGKSIGRLSVTYDIELRIPRVPLGLSLKSKVLAVEDFTVTSPLSISDLPSNAVQWTTDTTYDGDVATFGTDGDVNWLIEDATLVPPLLSGKKHLIGWMGKLTDWNPNCFYMAFSHPGVYAINMVGYIIGGALQPVIGDMKLFNVNNTSRACELVSKRFIKPGSQQGEWLWVINVRQTGDFVVIEQQTPSSSTAVSLVVGTRTALI